MNLQFRRSFQAQWGQFHFTRDIRFYFLVNFWVIEISVFLVVCLFIFWTVESRVIKQRTRLMTIFQWYNENINAKRNIQPYFFTFKYAITTSYKNTIPLKKKATIYPQTGLCVMQMSYSYLFCCSTECTPTMCAIVTDMHVINLSMRMICTPYLFVSARESLTRIVPLEIWILPRNRSSL